MPTASRCCNRSTELLLAVVEAVVSWFTEGTDTLDLKAARALLESLMD